nr:hepatocyte cell adhesion molecule-like isoform X2 [Paramormyrops kingsleyae]
MTVSLYLHLINCLTQSLLICGMSPVFGLFLIMATAAHGSAGSDSTNKTHYVALGRPAFIQLINGTSGYELTLQKDGTVIFSFRKNIHFRENWGSQFNFDMNGTLMITKAERNLSGIYTLGVFNLDGMNIRKETLNLIIEVPVTPPALSPLCLPHGELRVSCSSPVGDNPQYSWLLDGLPLNHSRPVYDDGKGAVILGKNTSGELTCTAKNNVSEEKATVMLPSCAVDTMPMLLAALGTMVLLPILTVGVYSYCKKRPHVQAEESKPDTEDMINMDKRENTVTEVVYRVVTM